MWGAVRERKVLAGQMLRYGISGAGITVFYSAIYWLTVKPLHIAPLIGNTVAFLCSVALGYVVHSRWSFKDHGSGVDTPTSYVRFFIVNIMGYLVNTFWVWFLVGFMRLDPIVPLLPIAFVTPWLSFWLNRRWVFG